jgi:hypothetical protein
MEILMGVAMAEDQKTAQLNFATEEFRALRSAIANTFKEVDLLEKTAGGSCAAIYTWLFSVRHPVIWWAWLVPVAIAILGSMRAVGLGWRFNAFRKYISAIEDKMYSAHEHSHKFLPGWEHFRLRRGWSWAVTTGSAFGFWLFLLAVTIIAAAYFHGHPITPHPN